MLLAHTHKGSMIYISASGLYIIPLRNVEVMHQEMEQWSNKGRTEDGMDVNNVGFKVFANFYKEKLI